MFMPAIDDPDLLVLLEAQKQAANAQEAALRAQLQRRNDASRAKADAGLRRDKRVKKGIVSISVFGGIAAAAIGLSRFIPNNNAADVVAAKAAQKLALDTLQSAINWRSNNIGMPAPEKGVSLETLQRLQGAGGMGVTDPNKLLDGVGNISGRTKDELLNLANAAGITDPKQQAEMFQQYTDAYKDACNTLKIDPANHTPEEAVKKAEALAESLKAVKAYIKNNTTVSSLSQANPIAHLANNIKETFSRLNPLASQDIKIASNNTGIVSDMGQGIISPQGGGVLQNLQHVAADTLHHLGDTAQHALSVVQNQFHEIGNTLGGAAQATAKFVQDNPAAVAVSASAVATLVGLHIKATQTGLEGATLQQRVTAALTKDVKFTEYGKTALELSSVLSIARTVALSVVAGRLH
jgi:ElaB/YqjD/DUF883 family membrane-anchored ribosome-binding protein